MRCLTTRRLEAEKRIKLPPPPSSVYHQPKLTPAAGDKKSHYHTKETMQKDAVRMHSAACHHHSIKQSPHLWPCPCCCYCRCCCCTCAVQCQMLIRKDTNPRGVKTHFLAKLPTTGLLMQATSHLLRCSTHTKTQHTSQATTKG